MKLNTMSRYLHTANLQAVFYRTDPNTAVKIPFWDVSDVQVKCHFITPSTGQPKVYSKTMLSSLDRLLSPKDAAGNDIFTDPSLIGFQITTVAPIIDSFGYINGYAYGVKRLATV